MLLIPKELRDNLITYIQANPSPNVSVGQVLQLLGQLHQLKTFGRPEVVSDDAESPVEPGDTVEETGEVKELADG